MIPPRSARLSGVSEQVRRSHEEAIREMQGLPATSIKIIPNVVVASGNSVTVAHGLGRAPRMVWVSAVRWDGAAFVAPGTFFDRGARDAAGNAIDRTQIVVLAADGFTSAGSVVLTIDVAVM